MSRIKSSMLENGARGEPDVTYVFAGQEEATAPAKRRPFAPRERTGVGTAFAGRL